MVPIYSNNPYYDLLVFFLIKARSTKINFKKNLFVKLSKEMQQELTAILTRNFRLNLLEQHKPGFFDKKTFDAGEYYRLEKQNAELLGVELEFPTLADLSARALSVYATQQGLFDSKRVDINKEQKQIGILAKKQPWYSNPLFGKKYTKLPQKVDNESFEKLMNIYASKTTAEKFKEKYQKLNNFYLTPDFKFEQNYYINSVANFLLACTINKDKTDFVKVLNIYDEWDYLLISPDWGAGITPLHIACELDASVALVERLIEGECNVNYLQTHSSITPLYRACMFNASVELINLLLKHGANLSLTVAPHLFYTTALHITCHLGYDKLALHLLQQGAKMNDLIGYNQKPQYVEGYYYYYHANALHLALKSGCKLAAQYMIEKNSDFSQVTQGEVHVLHLACQYGDHNLVKLLCGKLTDLHISDHSGLFEDDLYPADYALMNSNQEEKTAILEILKNLQVFPIKSDEEVLKILSSRCGEIKYDSVSSNNEIFPGM